MHTTPAETEKLLLAVAGMVGATGVSGESCSTTRVGRPAVHLGRRAGQEGASVVELMEQGRSVLRRDEVMPGVPEMITDVQVEATFPDGRKLVTLHHPID